MEGLTRLVSESLARHGFDRPLDFRRLHWSRWLRCESHHSLLFVPSKAGVFALAEEIMSSPEAESREPKADLTRRMLAVTQFFEDDDMAFTLDRMLSHQNPMRTRLISGRYFVRFTVIEDTFQRRSICNALNQWIANSTERAGIGAHFATSLELTPATEYVPENVGRTLLSAKAGTTNAQWGGNALGNSNNHVATDAFVRPASEASAPTNGHVETAASAVQRSEASGPTEEHRINSVEEPRVNRAPYTPVEERRFSAASSDPKEPAALAAEGRTTPPTAPHLNSGAATNIHCPSPFPSGF